MYSSKRLVHISLPNVQISPLPMYIVLWCLAQCITSYVLSLTNNWPPVTNDLVLCQFWSLFRVWFPSLNSYLQDFLRLYPSHLCLSSLWPWSWYSWVDLLCSAPCHCLAIQTLPNLLFVWVHDLWLCILLSAHTTLPDPSDKRSHYLF